VDAFDADVLIYATVADHQLGMRVRALFPIEPVEGTGTVAGIGSVLLLPELLSKPLREGAIDELDELSALLGRLDLRPMDAATAELATALGAAYRLRAADAVHLATAVNAGADRFITSNAADFPKSITEVDITYPVDLTAPTHQLDRQRSPGVPGDHGPQPGDEDTEPDPPSTSEVSGLCHDRRVTTHARPASDPAEAGPTARRTRTRLDQLLVERGLAGTRTRAQALILAGKVHVGDGDGARRDHKPGDRLPPDTTTIKVEQPEPYVSRGGHKLAAALDAFAIDPAGRVCLDVGASTGGFTDVLLQRGAARVYALDVGRGQLAEQLRQDPRVVSMERTNARTLTASALPEPVDVVVIDVSFISLATVLPAIITTLATSAHLVALVKPQFEAGKGRTDKGVVRDPIIHREVLERVTGAAAALGLGSRAVIASPILGPEGNREFLVHLAAGPGCADLPQRIAEVTAP